MSQTLPSIVSIHMSGFHIKSFCHSSMERILNQSIREQQDEAYMESLRADQEKQRQRDLEREEIRKIELEKQRLIQDELMKKLVSYPNISTYQNSITNLDTRCVGIGKSKGSERRKSPRRAIDIASGMCMHFVQNAKR